MNGLLRTLNNSQWPNKTGLHSGHLENLRSRWRKDPMRTPQSTSSRLRLRLRLNVWSAAVLFAISSQATAAPQGSTCHLLFSSAHGAPGAEQSLGGSSLPKITGSLSAHARETQTPNAGSRALNRISASWEISRQGVQELNSDLYAMENVLYYALTALMAKEHILVDGPGGGAKTLGIRKVYEAQLNALKDPAMRSDIDAFKRELIQVLREDAQLGDSSKQIFTQQFHATLSETKILGGPDPFKFTEKGKYEIDYSRALISDKNMFAILDEIEKAPVALQMTLLSILNERQAMAGNKVVQTMLESIAATTNATLGDLISQALPHEAGGRRALVDRFALKVNVLNVSENSNSLVLMLQKINAARGEKKFTVIDLRGLRPLLDKVEIPSELLKAMTDLSLHMDRFYTSKLLAAQAEVQGTPAQPDYFPPFSGSTRTQSKLIKIWKSAFLVRQLMDGVPFESLQLGMSPRDLVDLAPAVLQGGPDRLMANRKTQVHFYQTISNDGWGVVVSNSKDKDLASKNLSVGEYDENTQILSYSSVRTGERRYVKFDLRSGQLLTLDPAVKTELDFDIDLSNLSSRDPNVVRHKDLAKQLAAIHSEQVQSGRAKAELSYETTGRLKELLGETQSTARESTKKQLEVIEAAHAEFLAAVNSSIRNLEKKKLTRLSRASYDARESFFDQRSQRVRSLLNAAIQTNNKDKIQNAAAVTVREAFAELRHRFLESESSIKAILMAMINRKNVMLFGPPGAAKTLLTRTTLEAELKNLSQAQIAKANSVLADALLQQQDGAGSIWVKQFHPMSNEGDIVGRIDLKAVRDGQGYVYNRTGAMSANDVLFALLDEFEKAPAGVKTSLLSLLNERQLMDGDEVFPSNLIAVVIATNSTPGEFITGLGDFSTAFPIFDRIQTKGYSLNKLTQTALEEFHRRVYLGLDTKLKSPLFVYPLTDLAKSYKLDQTELRLLARIHQAFVSEAVAKSEAERKLHLGDPASFPDFYMNTRGESNRSAISSILSEFPGSVVLNRVLSGQSARAIRQSGNRFDPTDLVAFSELYTSFNVFYKIKHDYDQSGLIYFKVVETDLNSTMDRIDAREKKTIEDMKFEADTMARILNQEIKSFLADRQSAIASSPSLYPSLFAGHAQREIWARKAQSK